MGYKVLIISTLLFLSLFVAPSQNKTHGGTACDIKTVETLLAEVEPTLRQAELLFRQGKYTEALRLCKPMLTIEHAQGLFGPIAGECALRLEDYNYLSSKPDILALRNGNDSASAMILLKTKNFDEANLIPLRNGPIESFVEKDGLQSLLDPVKSAKQLEYKLFLRLSASAKDSRGKMLFLNRAHKVAPSNPLTHLLFALQRKDDHGRRQKELMQRDYALAWKSGSLPVRKYIQKATNQFGLSIDAITLEAAKQGKS